MRASFERLREAFLPWNVFNHFRREKLMRCAKALGLSLLAALSLMAFSVGAANAGELRGAFTVNGALLSATETVSGKLENPAVSSLLVPNLNFAIRCHEERWLDARILVVSNNRSYGHAIKHYLFCLAFTHKTLEALTKCSINEPSGTITLAVLFHIIRNKSLGTAYLLTEASAGLKGVLTKILFGPLCGALSEEEIEVTGSIVGSTSASGNELKIVEASEEIQLLFGDKLMFGTNQAFLDGAVLAQATGVGAGTPLNIEAGH